MGKFALTLQCLNHILTTNQSSGHDFRLSSLISSAGDRGSIPRRRVIFFAVSLYIQPGAANRGRAFFLWLRKLEMGTDMK
jgi:hypothetical protein